MNQLEGRPLKLASDMDGVLLKINPSKIKNTAKLGLVPIEGAKEGLKTFAEEPDIDLLGIFTARPRLLRAIQTRAQAKKHGFPDTIVHTPGFYANKVRTLLEHVAEPHSRKTDLLTPPPDLEKIAIIDDLPKKLIKGAHLLDSDPRYAKMLPRLTIVAFGPQKEQLQKAPSGVKVISMEDWSTPQIEHVLWELRNRIAA